MSEKDGERWRLLTEQENKVREDDLPLLLNVINNFDCRRQIMHMIRYLSNLSCIKIILVCEKFSKHDLFSNLLCKRNTITIEEFTLLNKNIKPQQIEGFIVAGICHEHTDYLSLAKELYYSKYINALTATAKYLQNPSDLVRKLCKEENIKIEYQPYYDK